LAFRRSRKIAHEFGVYLVHMLVLVPLLTLMAEMPWFEHSRPLVRFAVTAPVMIVVCYSIATITLMTIEGPFIAIGRKLSSPLKTA
jgi:peptidoglycan/LPS O-acetylase OafA/YrhL